jgi:hypothetical protein
LGSGSDHGHQFDPGRPGKVELPGPHQRADQFRTLRRTRFRLFINRVENGAGLGDQVLLGQKSRYGEHRLGVVSGEGFQSVEIAVRRSPDCLDGRRQEIGSRSDRDAERPERLAQIPAPQQQIRERPI